MRFFPFVTLLLLSVAVPLRAQTNAASAPAKPAAVSPEHQALAILTRDQQIEYAKAHEMALADDPALKAENDSLKTQYVGVMEHGTPAEKQAMMEKVDSHRLKLRKAMLKADPNLGPIFAQIDKTISEAKAKGTPTPAAAK